MATITHTKASYDVYVTTDYSMFKFLDGNRDVTYFKRIISCIQYLGYIGAPIVVNEKMEIIDGQNRFEALKILGLPVEYIIRPGLGINDVIALNTHSKKWSMMDFLSSHAKQGNATYKWIVEDICQRYEMFLVDDIVAIVNSRGTTCNNGSLTRSKVRDGQLDLTQEEMNQVVATMEWLKHYMPYVKKIAKGKTYPLINAIMWCEAHQKTSFIDMDRLLHVVFEKNWSKFIQRNQVGEYMVQIETCYNKGLSKNSKKRIYLSADYGNACRNAGLNVIETDGQTMIEEMGEAS